MSHIDATQALQIYRHFCKQTERVVEFLGVAKKLQNLLNVPIPNLKHVSVHAQLAVATILMIYASLLGPRLASRCTSRVLGRSEFRAKPDRI
jgi:hypothetical protein